MRRKSSSGNQAVLVACMIVTVGLLAFQVSLAAPKSDPIKVGLMVPLTGFAVEDGKQYFRAVNFAFEDIK